MGDQYPTLQYASPEPVYKPRRAGASLALGIFAVVTHFLIVTGFIHGEAMVYFFGWAVFASVLGLICGGQAMTMSPKYGLIGVLLSGVSLSGAIAMLIYFFTHLPVC